MKNTLIFLLFIIAFNLGLNSCSESTEQVTYYTPPPTQKKNLPKDYKVIIIDKCEYIVRWRQMAHKGNCTNHKNPCE